MKQHVALVCMAAAAALLAWAFWHYVGNNAFSLLPTIMLVIVALDNLRLRRQLRARAEHLDR